MGFTAGPVLSRTFAIFFRNFLPFTAISLLVNLPSIIVTAWTILSLDKTDLASWEAKLTFAERFSGLTGFIFTSLASGAIVFSVMQELRGRKASFGECLSQGASALPRVIGISILEGLAIGLGALMFVIPGVIVAIMLSCAPVVGVIERRGVMDSLRRSADLTSGYRAQIFLVYLCLGLLMAVPTAVIIGISRNPGGTLDELYSTIVRMNVIGDIIGVLLGGLLATAPAVIYHGRQAKEGVDADAIASVFD